MGVISGSLDHRMHGDAIRIETPVPRGVDGD